MGILDDAIRQHLELKRKHGARDAELQQLEDEAFGPPARPGEPDFPERTPTGEHAEEGGTAVATAPEAETGEEQVEAEPLDHPVEPAATEPEEPGFFDQASDLAADREGIAGEPTVEHPAPFPEPDDAPAPAEPVAEEAPPPLPPDPPPEEVAPPSEASEEFEVGELELELDEEFEEFRDTDDPAPEAAGTELAEPASDEHDELAEPAAGDEHDELPEPAAGDEPGEEGEDVLEETPEFLRDTPEDERLWFEQGAPKDFDFDDEDEDKDDAP